MERKDKMVITVEGCLQTIVHVLEDNVTLRGTAVAGGCITS
jgi:hypothetical protein